MAEKLGPSRDCVRCGETFLLPRLGRKGHYCSRNCRQRAYEERRALGMLAPVLGAVQGYAAKPGGERRYVTDETPEGAREDN